MTTLQQDSRDRVVLTASERSLLEAQLEHDTMVVINLAARIGREEVKPTDLTEYERLLEHVERLRAELRAQS